MRYVFFFQFLLHLVIGIAICAFLLWNADSNDTYMSAYADCIAHEARSVAYKGTHEQAWTLFAPLCR